MRQRTVALVPFLAALACTSVCAPAAAQQSYPTKTVRIVVPYPAGGGVDIIGRFAADGLTARLGRQVIVDNRPGGSSVIGAEHVARAAPDGYTLLVTSNTTLALIPNLRRNLPFDPVRDFEPVSGLASQSFTLVVHPSLPVRRVRDLVALARARPGMLTYSSAGTGSTSHFAGEQLKLNAGIDLLHVPYKGAGPALNDLLGGHVTMSFASASAVAPFVKDGRLRLIATTGAKRSLLAPEVPTLAESGVRGFEVVQRYALLAPKGTPAAFVERLNAEVVAMVAAPEMQKRLIAMGYEPATGTPQALAENIRTDLARYAKLVQATGFKAQ